MRLSAHCTAPRFGLARSKRTGFTLVEVMVALVIVVLFAAAAFATNSQLLIKLKAQKETTAATMLLQRRMEQLRASAWSDVATASYLKDTIIADPAPGNLITQQQIDAYIAALKNAEAPLSDLSEKITVSVYPPDGGSTGVAERNSSYPTGHIVSYISGNSAETSTTVYSYLTTPPKSATLVRVDILLTWDGAGARTLRRGRQLSSVFGIGNIAP
jgi:prepilin-type N-terminal cleavage/methylation domain-containing protein